MQTKLEVIIVLGGMLYREPDGHWRTTNFEESGDNFGITGDRVRVIAAGFLAEKDKNLKIIVSGGKGQLSGVPDCPTLSSVLRKELIELTIAPQNIIEESTSGNTYQQLKNSLEIVRKLNLSKVGIVSNEYHLPRVGALLEHTPNLNLDIELISAEQIAIIKDPEYWEQEIKNAYAREDMKKRIALEQKGIRDIKEGKYNFN